ncbi:MAG: hypothetical protein AAGA75_19650 [Cyanobacteria bacterium P01_E01_bin.6]
MLSNQGWIIGLLSLNSLLTLCFLGFAWKLKQLKCKASAWANSLARLDQELSNVLAIQPKRLSVQSEKFQNFRRTYYTWQLTLEKVRQTFMVVRFLVNLSMGYRKNQVGKRRRTPMADDS